jgi:hypothetical protein
MEDEIEYYGRREAEERRAAERARSPKAAESHRALADQYARRIRKRPSSTQ